MPHALSSFLSFRSLKFHLFLALFFGLLFRLLTAYYVYSAMALDDYLHGTFPARRFAMGRPMDLVSFRSPLLVYMLSPVFYVSQFFFPDQAVTEARLVGALLALLSVGCVIGAYLYVKSYSPNAEGALIIYLMALFPLMPFASTRTFGESVSMPFVLMGIGVAEAALCKKNYRLILLGLGLLVFSALLRFQNGLIFVVYSAILFLRDRRTLLATIAAAGIGLGAEAAIDLLSHRSLFSTLLTYLSVNSDGGKACGTQPWYVFIAMFSACVLGPLGLPLCQRAGFYLKRHWVVALVFVAFVAIHTIVPHKEERFMIPVLPLFVVLLGAAWWENRNSTIVRRFFGYPFLLISAIALIVISTSNTQVQEIEPIVELQRVANTGALLETEKRVAGSYFVTEFYLRKPIIFGEISRSDINVAHLRSLFLANPKWEAIAVVDSTMAEQPELNNVSAISNPHFSCGPARRASSFLDTVIYSLNPTRNTRRHPSHYVICRRA